MNEVDQFNLSFLQKAVFHLLKTRKRVPAEEILSTIWKEESKSYEDLTRVRVCITKLRKKISPRYLIQSRWGIGYLLIDMKGKNHE